MVQNTEAETVNHADAVTLLPLVDMDLVTCTQVIVMEVMEVHWYFYLCICVCRGNFLLEIHGSVAMSMLLLPLMKFYVIVLSDWWWKQLWSIWWLLIWSFWWCWVRFLLFETFLLKFYFNAGAIYFCYIFLLFLKVKCIWRSSSVTNIDNLSLAWFFLTSATRLSGQNPVSQRKHHGY